MAIKRSIAFFSLLIVVISLFVIFYPAWTKAKIGATVVYHKAIYIEINDYYKQHGTFPMQMNELEHTKRAIYTYPPDSANDNFVLLESNLYGVKIVTYKNGNIEVLKDGKIKMRRQYPY